MENIWDMQYSKMRLMLTRRRREQGEIHLLLSDRMLQIGRQLRRRSLDPDEVIPWMTYE